MSTKNSKQNQPCTLHNVSGSVFLKEIHKQIKKYEEEHSHVEIITCDVADVYEWLRKAEKKVIKKHCR